MSTRLFSPDESVLSFWSKLTMRQNMTKGRVGTGVAIAALVLVGAWRWSAERPIVAAERTSADSPAGSTEPALPVVSRVVEEAETYLWARQFTGRVQARRASSLGFEIGGRIVDVLVEEGDRVEQGATMARLDPITLQQRRRQIAARRQQAIAVLEELESGPRAERIAMARAAVEERRAELKLSQLQTRRRERMVAEEVVSQEELDTATTQTEALEARLARAQQELEELETGTRPEQIAAQKATVQLLEAELASLDIELDKTELRAPYDAVITVRHLDEGTVVEIGQSVVRLLEDQVLEARVGVSQEAAAALEAGQEYALLAEGKPVPARVRAVLPEVDAVTRTRLVILDVPLSSTPSVVAGQTIRLTVREQRATSGIFVPTTALTKGERGLWSCFCLEPEGSDFQVVRHEVEILHHEAEQVLVRGSLKAGDRVITAGVDRVVPGQRVNGKL